MDPALREEAYQRVSYAKKYQTIDIRDCFLIPTPKNRGPNFDERLREAIDIDAHIEESAQELKEYANKRIPLPPKDLNEKDTDLLSKMSLVAQAVKVDEKPIFGVDMDENWMIEDTFRRELPSDKRILTDEIYKILYFNNADPNKYTVSFWADHFQINAATIRNIVNYVAYPLTDLKTKEVTQVLYFIDSEL